MTLGRSAVAIAWLVIVPLLGACVSEGSVGEEQHAVPEDTAGSAPDVTAPSAELYAPLMQACLARSGFAVQVRDDGGVEIEFDADLLPDQMAVQQEEYMAAQGECLEETGFDRPSGVSTEELYRQFIAVDDCVRAAGYAVESPSLDEFERGSFPDNDAILPADPAERVSLFELCEGTS